METSTLNTITTILRKLWKFLTRSEVKQSYFTEPFNLKRDAFFLSALYFEYSGGFLDHNSRWKAKFHSGCIVLSETHNRVGTLYSVAGRFGQYAFIEHVKFTGDGPTESDLAKAVDIVLAKLYSLPEVQRVAEADASWKKMT